MIPRPKRNVVAMLDTMIWIYGHDKSIPNSLPDTLLFLVEKALLWSASSVWMLTAKPSI